MARTLGMRGLKLLHFCVAAALFMGCWKLFYEGEYSAVSHRKGELVLYAFYTVFLVLLSRTYDVYDIGYHRVTDSVYAQSLSQFIDAGVLWIVSLLMYMKLTNPLPLVGLCALQLLWNMAWSVGANHIYHRLHLHKRTVLIYRNGEDLQRLREIIGLSRKFDIQKRIVDPPDDFSLLEKELAGFEAIVVSGVNASLRNGIAKYCIESGAQGYFAPHVGDIIMQGARHMRNFTVPIMSVRRVENSLEYLCVKRAFDIAASAAAMLALSPLILATAAAIRLYDGGPVLYRQTRLTRDGKTFEMLKFRSMRMDAEKDGVARLSTGERDERVTPVGRLIRSCHMDELPQLINILRGDMSIVGPRPERPEIAAEYEKRMPAFSLRLQVKAGLTGYAQVYGRYNTDPYDKLQMDLIYINKMNVVEDLRLIVATVRVLFLKTSTQGVAVGQQTALRPPEGTGKENGDPGAKAG